MKILSDFDGVMTDQTEEGEHEHQLFRDKLAELAPLDGDAVDALIARAQAELAANPTKHGWWSQGRVSAYADEDLFIKVIGTAVCLEQWAADGDNAAAEARKGLVDGGFETYVKLSDWAYNEMAAHTSKGDITPMDPIVADVLNGFLDKGVEIVVVSNSATDRVMQLLETLDLEPVRHIDDPTAQFRVRGDARKFNLGPESKNYEIDGFTFDVARPNYLEILTDETPNVAIGDVFSLDLALPLWLTRNEPDTYGGMQILLRTRAYTPAWSKKICTRDEAHARMGLLDDFGKLPTVVG